MEKYINLTPDNIDKEHLCCIIRSRKPDTGVEAKRSWLKERLKEGHVFRKLNAKAAAFIEYAPLETAWVPIEGENYLYIYCLWAIGEAKGKGIGKELMEYCLADAKERGFSGVCMLGSSKQKAWLSDQGFARRYGFEDVDFTDNGYKLLALSFDATLPHFVPSAKTLAIEDKTLTIYYDLQCPYIPMTLEKIESYCREEGVPLSLIRVESLQQAKALPCVFNNWAVFYKGKFETVNLLSIDYLQRILRK